MLHKHMSHNISLEIDGLVHLKFNVYLKFEEFQGCLHLFLFLFDLARHFECDEIYGESCLNI